MASRRPYCLIEGCPIEHVPDFILGVNLKKAWAIYPQHIVLRVSPCRKSVHGQDKENHNLKVTKSSRLTSISVELHCLTG